jgi:hypothetical protein
VQPLAVDDSPPPIPLVLNTSECLNNSVVIKKFYHAGQDCGNI